MKKFFRMNKKTLHNSKGFTIPELMIVLVIITILVAIAIPIYSDVSGSAELRVCQANLRSLDGAANQYKSEHGEYPDSYEDLESPDFFLNIPTCPTTGEGYNYDPDTGRFSCDYEGHFYPH